MPALEDFILVLPNLLTVHVRLYDSDARAMTIEEFCPVHLSELGWALDSNGESRLACAECGNVLTLLSRGVSIDLLRDHDSSWAHPEDLSLLSRRLFARMDELSVSPLEQELNAEAFIASLKMISTGHTCAVAPWDIRLM